MNNKILTHKRLTDLIINYDSETQSANLRVNPFVKLQNDT